MMTGRGPSESLVGAQQYVGPDDPAPGRREHDHERNGNSYKPAKDQDGLTTVEISQSPSEEIHNSLHNPERDQKGERHTARREPELLLRQQRQNGALQSQHGTHEGVDEHEEPELVPVRSQPEFDGTRWSRR